MHITGPIIPMFPVDLSGTADPHKERAVLDSFHQFPPPFESVHLCPCDYVND
jgi:hypothetical protein